MRVGVIDIGSNTARLLVADVGDDGVVQVARRRAYLGLGSEIARTGTLAAESVGRTATIAGAYAQRARRLGAMSVQTVVTAPGRQGLCGEELVSAVRRSTEAAVRILDADEEGRLAFDGAVHRATRPLPEVIGVVDVGGGSTEIAVGTPLVGPAWVRSLDLGSLRLQQRALDADPPSRADIDRARGIVADALVDIDAPRPDLVLAVGGSARGVAKVVGSRFGEDDLAEVVRIAETRAAHELERVFHLHPHRARTLLAGTLLLDGVARHLDRPFTLARGGVREGAALEVARAHAAAA